MTTGLIVLKTLILFIFCGCIFLNNIGSPEIVSLDNSCYTFNITWSPEVLENNRNYSISVMTENKKYRLDKFRLCLQISIDSINGNIFDDCTNTSCADIRKILEPIVPIIDFWGCDTRGIDIKTTHYIDEWVPLIAGNFNVTFNITLPEQETINGTGTIKVK